MWDCTSNNSKEKLPGIGRFISFCPLDVTVVQMANSSDIADPGDFSELLLLINYVK